MKTPHEFFGRADEGVKEDKVSCFDFFQRLKSCGLNGVKLFIEDNCMVMSEAAAEVFLEVKCQLGVVYFYRNVFRIVPKSKVKLVAKILKATYARESKKAFREKAKAIVAELRTMKLKETAKKIEDGVDEYLTYCNFPSEY